jgi:hypothetical protein
VLDLGFVHQVLALFLAAEGFLRLRIQNLFLDLRMHCQQLTDALRDRGLLFVVRFLELFEQLGHRAVVLLQQRDRVARRIGAAARSISRSRHGALL